MNKRNRIIIFTGKGGVGKTSIAAAHAKKSADQGKKTLLVSTDMAHNLGDIFEINCGKEIKSVSEYLDIFEIDPEYVCEEDYKNLVDCLTNMLPDAMDRTMESFGMLPGMEELFSLMKISDLYETGVYENIIVDCAPTGETLSLLKFPELLSWYMEKLFPIGKTAMKIMAPVSKAVLKVQLPDKKAMSDIEKLYMKLYELQELLKNEEITSVRLVTVPEKMVVMETKRNYMYMNLYHFNVDGLYMNRILPKDIDNPFFEKWLEIQKEYTKELENCFTEVPIYRVPWYGQEVRGEEAISRIAGECLDDKVFENNNTKQRETFEELEDGYLLNVYVPNASKEELDVYKAEGDVIIKINNFKRNIPLPNMLRKYEIVSAKFEDGILKLKFQL